MKTKFRLTLIILSLNCLLVSCNLNSIFDISDNISKHCVDNISFENNKINYKNLDLVEFKCDTNSVFDTVFLDLEKDIGKRTYNPKDANKDGDPGTCSVVSYIKYSNLFGLGIVQSSNEQGNGIWYMDNPYLTKTSPYVETVTYTYNNKTITAYHVNYDNSKLWKYYTCDSNHIYNDYYYIRDKEIKLLQYSTYYKDGSIKIWKLKE